MTPEGWKVLGCALIVLSVGFIAVGLYACFRTGFGDPSALALIRNGALLMAFVGVVWYLVRRWLG